MFAKLLLIIALIGATACILLVNRQQRIETANEIAQTHRHLLQHDQALWALRNEIASRCTPDQVRAAMSNFQGKWHSIPTPPDGEEPSVAEFATDKPVQSVKNNVGG